MSIPQMILAVLFMAGVTYLIRMIPMTFFRKKLKSQFLYSLFFYLPYAVLSAMTFPYIFFSTNNLIASIGGTVVALIAALNKRSLLTVAILACLTVFVMEFFIVLI